jgi:hypothetical protein
MPDEHEPDRPPDDRRPPPYTPYLKIRYEVGDLNQPRGTLPPGTVFWASPDITMTPTDGLGNAQARVPTTIQVRVFNWGLAAAIPTSVDFFWADPSLGISAASVHKINQSPVLVSVPAQNYVTVACPDPWIPEFLNGGHECLIVQADCPADPILHPLSPPLDRHVGQRNITVSSPTQPLQLQVRLDNAFNDRLTFQLFHSATALRGDLVELERDEAIALLTARRPGHFGPGIEHFDISNEIGVRIVGREAVETERGEDTERIDRTRTLERVRLLPDYDAGHGTEPVGSFTLNPHESLRLTLRAEAGAGAQTTILHQFTQVLDGCEVGGYCALVPSEELAKRWELGASEGRRG